MDFLEEDRDKVFASFITKPNMTTETAEKEEMVTERDAATAISRRRKRKQVSSGKPSSTTPFEEKMIEIEEEKLLYIKKTFELQEKTFLWKKELEERTLALREREIALRERELDLKSKELDIKKTLI